MHGRRDYTRRAGKTMFPEIAVEANSGAAVHRMFA